MYRKLEERLGRFYWRYKPPKPKGGEGATHYSMYKDIPKQQSITMTGMDNAIESNRSSELGMEYDDVECFLLGKLSAKDLERTREGDRDTENVPLQFEVEADIEPVKEQPYYETNEPIYEELPDIMTTEAVYEEPPDATSEPVYDDIVIPKRSSSSLKHHYKHSSHHHGKHHHRHHHHHHHRQEDNDESTRSTTARPPRPRPPRPPLPSTSALYRNTHITKND